MEILVYNIGHRSDGWIQKLNVGWLSVTIEGIEPRDKWTVNFYLGKWVELRDGVIMDTDFYNFWSADEGQRQHELFEILFLFLLILLLCNICDVSSFAAQITSLSML